MYFNNSILHVNRKPVIHPHLPESSIIGRTMAIFLFLIAHLTYLTTSSDGSCLCSPFVFKAPSTINNTQMQHSRNYINFTRPKQLVFTSIPDISFLTSCAKKLSAYFEYVFFMTFLMFIAYKESFLCQKTIRTKTLPIH